MVQEDGIAPGSSASPRTEAEGESNRQVAAHETPLPTPPAASSTATEGRVVTKDEEKVVSASVSAIACSSAVAASRSSSPDHLLPPMSLVSSCSGKLGQ